jgi:hypothetical protein
MKQVYKYSPSWGLSTVPCWSRTPSSSGAHFHGAAHPCWGSGHNSRCVKLLSWGQTQSLVSHTALLGVWRSSWGGAEFQVGHTPWLGVQHSSNGSHIPPGWDRIPGGSLNLHACLALGHSSRGATHTPLWRFGALLPVGHKSFLGTGGTNLVGSYYSLGQSTLSESGNLSLQVNSMLLQGPVQ